MQLTTKNYKKKIQDVMRTTNQVMLMKKVVVAEVIFIELSDLFIGSLKNHPVSPQH